MKTKAAEIICISFFALLSFIIFRSYFLEQKVPLNGNLLVAFFQPWASYEFKGYAVGPPAKPIGSDALRIYYPTRKLVTEHFKNGAMPLWNPYQFSGNVLLGTFQAAAFFPLGILFFFLPQVDAWSIIVILQPFLGSFFMYLFLKQIIRDKRAIFFGAITFGFSGMLISWWEEMFMAGYSVILFPLILYGIEKNFKRVCVSSFLVLFSTVLVSLSTGWFQMIFYSWFFSFIWTVFRYFSTRNRKAFFVVFLCFVVALAVSGAYLLPSIEAYLYSSRGAVDIKNDFETYLMPLYHVVSFVAPDFFGNPASHNFFGIGFYHESVLYIGILGFLFAIYEFISFGKRQSAEKFFKIAWILSLSLGFSLPTSWFFLYALKIPFISTLLPSRIFFVSSFCASVLAAFGIQRYFKSNQKKQIIIAVTIVGLILFSAWFYTFSSKKVTPGDINHARISIRNLLLPSLLYTVALIVLLAGMVDRRLKNISYAIFIAVTVVGILYFTQKYLYFSEKDFIFPSVPVLTELKKRSGIDRFLGVGEGSIDRNFAMYYGLFSPEGYDSFNNKRYSELVYSSHTLGKYSEKMPRADVLIMKSQSLKDTLENPYRKRMISLLGIKYLVEKRGENDLAKTTVSDSDVQLVWTDNVFNIYKNKNALARVFFVYDYYLLKEKQQILNKIYDKTTDLSRKAILEEPPQLSVNNKGIGNIRVISYAPEHVELRGETNENGVLVLSDNYYPGWKAFIDGKEVSILRANYTFRAVAVPKGNHTIVFRYHPLSFYLGLYVSGAGVILLIGVLYLLKAKEDLVRVELIKTRWEEIKRL